MQSQEVTQYACRDSLNARCDTTGSKLSSCDRVAQDGKLKCEILRFAFRILPIFQVLKLTSVPSAGSGS